MARATCVVAQTFKGCQEKAMRTPGATVLSRCRIFARTARGYYCLLPDLVREGDVIVVLFGSKTPFCLRLENGGYYLLLGECYVRGLVDGEAIDMLQRGELDRRTFEVL